MKRIEVGISLIALVISVVAIWVSLYTSDSNLKYQKCLNAPYFSFSTILDESTASKFNGYGIFLNNNGSGVGVIRDARIFIGGNLESKFSLQSWEQVWEFMGWRGKETKVRAFVPSSLEAVSPNNWVPILYLHKDHYNSEDIERLAKVYHRLGIVIDFETPLGETGRVQTGMLPMKYKRENRQLTSACN
ncbi:hypothetical protein ACJJI3_22820 [Microbulbifer sp. ZKSA004]|uniref:hypothetical protein n=1 Tax=Microbulbifer sp. ZKSA004 TaxID=3243389 RepID=UPI004039D821